MLKLLSIALLALSFNLAPVAQAATAATETVKTEKVEKKSSETKSEKVSCEHCKKNGHSDKECACDGAKDCKCSKAVCDSGECKKKDSKKYCKHCAEHKPHAEEHKNHKE